MRLILVTPILILMLSAARADLAPPPLAPPLGRASPVVLEKSGEVSGAEIAEKALKTMSAAAASTREDLVSLIESVQTGNDASRKGRSVEIRQLLPPNPCASDMAAAARLCVQWLRRTMAQMEAATLDLMRAAGYDALADLRLLASAMENTIEELGASARGEPPPARTIPQNPCQGWNVSFWRECVTRVDERLAGQLVDDQSRGEIVRSRDALKQSLEAMITRKSMDGRGINAALAVAMKLRDSIARSITRCEEAQRVLSRETTKAGGAAQ